MNDDDVRQQCQSPAVKLSHLANLRIGGEYCACSYRSESIPEISGFVQIPPEQVFTGPHWAS